MSDVLQQVQEKQFTDRAWAEQTLLSFVRKLFPLDVVRVELRPTAVSLNSFNGLLILSDGTRLFFKTHTEAHTIIDEYYNAAMLARAGYPVLQPLYSSTEVGRQFLIYEVVNDPSVFDMAWAIECGDASLLPRLTTAQETADQQLRRIYQRTLEWRSGDAAAGAPIHQLFFHRLVGGRLKRFLDKTGTIVLPAGEFSLADVRSASWTINDRRYQESLDDLVADAIALLDPAQAGPSIIGHGDAHNGNMFFRQNDDTLMYFDPAFAGRHDPLLDLTKPLFHNVFATWMYFPLVKQRQTGIHMRYEGGRFHVHHDYHLDAVRLMFLRSKVDNVLIPLLRELDIRRWLRPDWRRYVKAALFCCPLLTVNLADPTKLPPAISLLGLAHAVEMGADGKGEPSLIDQTLEEVEAALRRR